MSDQASIFLMVALSEIEVLSTILLSKSGLVYIRVCERSAIDDGIIEYNR